jgi:hypothetical protein
MTCRTILTLPVQPQGCSPSRNYYTHYKKALYERAARGQELAKIARKLKVLLEVCLITQTGLDEKKSGELFSKIREVREDAFGSVRLKRK